MPQLHFSVDEDTAKRIEREAMKRGLTVSKYLASIVAQDLGASWPTKYLDAVVGSCAGTSFGEPTEPPLDDIDLPSG